MIKKQQQKTEMGESKPKLPERILYCTVLTVMLCLLVDN